MPKLFKTLWRELSGGIAISLVAIAIALGTLAIVVLFMTVTEPSQQGLRWRHSHQVIR